MTYRRPPPASRRPEARAVRPAGDLVPVEPRAVIALAAWREYRGRTQKWAAGQLGVTQVAVAAHERRGRVSLDNLRAYARLYDLTVDQLLAGPPRPATQEPAEVAGSGPTTSASARGKGT